MAIDLKWIDLIWMRCATVYGQSWLRQWDGLDIALVKSQWAQELDGVTPEGIAHGLRHLPRDWPPNAIQFRDACQRVAVPEAVALPPPKAGTRSESVASRVKGLLRQLGKRRHSGQDARQWAINMRQRELRGERLSPYQKQAWRKALGQDCERDDAQEPDVEVNRD